MVDTPSGGTRSRWKDVTAPKKFPVEFKRDVVRVACRGDLSHARAELVRRVRSAGRPAAHVAAEMGVSRRAHRWLARFDAEGLAGLRDRSSRPGSCPTRTPAEVERAVLACRDAQRIGRDRVAELTGVAAVPSHAS